MKVKIELINDFHNTRAFVIPTYYGSPDGWLSARQIKRAKHKLCPFKDCKCSGATGVRGGYNTIDLLDDGSGRGIVTAREFSIKLRRA